MLYVVGLPVGNFRDMPFRNLDMIKNAKYIIAENEDNFKEVLSKLEIETAADITYLKSQEDGNVLQPDEKTLLPRLAELLLNEEDVYLISDDGMPGIADPGQTIIKWCHKNGFKVSATPGPSALIAAVTVAGCGHNFRFHSFFQTDKDKRLLQIEGMKWDTSAQIVMLRNSMGFGEDAFVSEIPEVFQEIIKICGDREATLCYDLTKSNETIVRGNISYLLQYHMKHRNVKQHVMLVMEGYKV